MRVVNGGRCGVNLGVKLGMGRGVSSDGGVTMKGLCMLLAASRWGCCGMSGGGTRNRVMG